MIASPAPIAIAINRKSWSLIARTPEEMWAETIDLMSARVRKASVGIALQRGEGLSPWFKGRMSA